MEAFASPFVICDAGFLCLRELTMTYQAMTPFRRAENAVCIPRDRTPLSPACDSVNKWALLRDLAAGREAFGVSDRDLTVLQALLSFYPGNDLDDPARLIVHPSNATICERLNGMPCSTMRRHLARLVDAGLILRHDSPNGKRYVRRSPFGEQRFGFDLSPLPGRAGEIQAAAQQARDTASVVASLRSEISLMRRDVIGLLDLAESHGPPLPQGIQYRNLLALMAPILRRKLNVQELSAFRSEIANMLRDIKDEIDCLQSKNLSIRDDQNEQHYQRSNKEDFESEGSEKKVTCSAPFGRDQDLSLSAVLLSCNDIVQFSGHDISSWPDLIRAADQVCPMMGIKQSTWIRAKQELGNVCAATTLAAILQRFSQIRSPGAYLQALVSKAVVGQFSVVSMIKALNRQAGPCSQL